MRMMLLAGAASLAGGGAYYGGAFHSGEYYEMAPAEVSEKLQYMQLPEEFTHALGESGMLQFRTLSATSEAVEWDLLLNGHGVAEITAELSPSGSGTRVAIDFEVLESALAQDLAAGTPIDNEFVGEVVEMGFAEQIDSHLDGRPFNKDKLAFALAMHVAANPGKVQAYAKEMQEMEQSMTDEDVERFEEMANDMAEDAALAADAPMGDDWAQ